VRLELLEETRPTEILAAQVRKETQVQTVER
jgi:hypothetical protein